MNTGTTVYRSANRMQLLNERHHREELHDRLKGALEKIHIIEMAASDKVRDDPLECVDELKTKVDKLFSDIPSDYRTKESKSAQKKREAAKENAQSKISMKNPDFEAGLSARGKRSKVANPHEAVVGSKKPLMLSWDANRALTGKRPGSANTATSQYAALTNGGSLEAPQENRRKEVQEKRTAMYAKFIPLDKTRKAKILEVKARPATGKVNAGFVPNCAAVAVPDVTRRQEVEEINGRSKSALASNKNFR